MTQLVASLQSSFDNLARKPGFAPAWFIVLSLFLTLHNKYVLDDVFKSSNALLVIQNVLSILTLLVLRKFKMVSDFNHNVLHATKQEVFAAISAAINVVCGLASLRFLNVVSFGVLKRLTCVCSWLIEIFYDRRDTSFSVTPALMMMIAGAVVSAYGDMKFSAAGYSLAIISCFAQGSMFELGRRTIIANTNSRNETAAASQVEEKKSLRGEQEVEGEGNKKNEHQEHGYASVLYLNSAMTLFISSLALAVTSGFSVSSPSSPSSSSSSSKSSSSLIPADVSLSFALFQVTLNGTAALMLNHAIFLNAVTNSSLTQAVSGNVKAAFQTILGFLLFETNLDSRGKLGVVLSVLSGFLYSWIRFLKLTPKEILSCRKFSDEETSSTSREYP